MNRNKQKITNLKNNKRSPHLLFYKKELIWEVADITGCEIWKFYEKYSRELQEFCGKYSGELWE